jgi:putative heme iron utilization protein
MAKKTAKKKTALITPSPTSSVGVLNAEKFFDQVEDPVAGPGLVATILQYQQSIINIANTMGYAFTYDDMQDHLEKRWKVGKPTTVKPRFCCT